MGGYFCYPSQYPSVDNLDRLEFINDLVDHIGIIANDVHIDYNMLVLREGPAYRNTPLLLKKTSRIYETLKESIKNKDNIYRLTTIIRKRIDISGKIQQPLYLLDFRIVNKDPVSIAVTFSDVREDGDYNLTLNSEGINNMIGNVKSKTIKSPGIYEVHWTVKNDWFCVEEI